MSTTRSGLIYNNPDATTGTIRSKNIKNKTTEQVSTRPQRSTRTKFTAEYIREFCLESDDDDSLDYSPEDEEVQQYNPTTNPVFNDELPTRGLFVNRCYHTLTIPPSPRYEVNIDFDEASEAWRANKRRIGEQWAYRRSSKRKVVESEVGLRRSPRNLTK